MPAITAKSPGKTILFGEHAVVYGFPAIAVPLPAINLQVSFLGLPGQPAGFVRIRNANTHTDELLSQLSVGSSLSRGNGFDQPSPGVGAHSRY